MIYLFYQEGRPLSSALDRAFRQSTFPIECPSRLPISKFGLQETWTFTPRKLFFALRIDYKTKQWIDILLAQKVFRMLPAWEVHDRLRHQLRFIAFFMPFWQQSSAILQQIVLPEPIAENIQPLVDLIAYQCDRYQIASPLFSRLALTRGFAALDILSKGPQFVTKFGNSPDFVNEINSYLASCSQIHESFESLLTEEVLNLWNST
jgi:hypothetical protein